MQLAHDRSGSGPPLVLIHGIGSRRQVWDPVAPTLTAEREVITIDLPGFGASPMPPPGTPAGVASLTELVSAFLDGAGLARPHLAGNSLGGWLALELARRGRVASATALSPAGFWTPAEARFARTSLFLTVRAARLTAPVADRLMRPAPTRRAIFYQLAHRGDRIPPRDAAETVRALAGAPWFDDSLAAIITDRYVGTGPLPVPATIAWGERDRLLLRRQAARAAAAVPGARSLLLRGCGHVPTYDDPAQVARVILDGSRTLT
jgi:pimeloyl-ACP methyl ester carboxylesterase